MLEAPALKSYWLKRSQGQLEEKVLYGNIKLFALELHMCRNARVSLRHPHPAPPWLSRASRWHGR